MRAYLISCGADIKEDSTAPLHEDLDQLLSACNITFKNEMGTWFCHSIQLNCFGFLRTSDAFL